MHNSLGALNPHKQSNDFKYSWVKDRTKLMTKPPISKELLEILACPVCKQKVELKGEKLVCVKCGRKYPIVDGIPNMLPDELR
jgi:uncharacterized protein YbaR (Trm112 family)